MYGFKYLTVVLVGLLTFCGCGEKEEEETAEEEFDVQFVVPVGIETTNGLMTFTVTNGMAPLTTDSFLIEPVSGSSFTYSYSCAITKSSSSSFTVELPSTIPSGQYAIYVEREGQRKSYGNMYVAYVRVGKVLPNWFEGELDIHFINTGHGECTYQILPDGTTFLVDASGAMAGSGYSDPAPWKPNDTASAGQTIVNYINHFSPAVSKGHLNYFLLTHHHGDHMGNLTSDMAYHSSGKFRLSSLPEIGANLVMDKIFDRDWPDFSYPTAETGTMMTNYMAFLDWTASINGSVIEKWDVGSRKQVVPVNSSSWSVVIRNYAGSGCCWTGGADGETTTSMPTAEEFATLGSDAIPNENCFSCAYILTYGKFDFFLGGDLVSSSSAAYPYKDVESPLVDALYKVEVAKANHHGSEGSNSAKFVNKIAPDVWLVGVWTKTLHPGPTPAKNVIAANPDCEIFCTYQSEENIASLGEDVASHIACEYGHIVVRVTSGGGSYMIYTLEDSDEEYIVKSVHGPYICGD